MWKCIKCGKEFQNKEQTHYCQKPKDIDEYILTQPENVRPLLQRLRDIIREAAPDAIEKIAWDMPTFWQEENIIHFAGFKKHIGLYPGGEAVAVFGERLKEYKTTKGAIQISFLHPIDDQLIIDLVYWRLNQLEVKKSIKQSIKKNL